MTSVQSVRQEVDVGPFKAPANDAEVAAAILADSKGDAHAAVAAMVRIVRELVDERDALLDAASPGYARRRFRKS